jgi:hypothetical protein
MAKRKELGRILFPGNPWPKGHAISSFKWSGRIERGTGIWFDLHLETTEYYADDPKSHANYYEEDDDDSADDWTSKSVWCNYHSCTISSTKWVGNGTGFLAGTKIAPLDFAKLGKKTFSFDDNPEDLSPPRPFGIYLTGHDSVCGHRIRFKPEKSKTTFTIEWTGKIALSYGGSDEFKYSFQVSLSNVRFDGIQLPHNTSSFDAIALAEPFLRDVHSAWKISKTKDALRLMPK